MKAVVAAFNQEKALVGAFSVITNLRMQLFEALVATDVTVTLYYVQVSSARQLSWLPATGSISPAMGIFSALLTLAVAPFAGRILLYHYYYYCYPLLPPQPR